MNEMPTGLPRPTACDGAMPLLVYWLSDVLVQVCA